MPAIEDVNRNIEELVLLLSMAQRMLSDIKADLSWVKIKDTSKEAIGRPIVRKKNDGHINQNSPHINRNIRVYCERNPDVSYEDVALKYGVHIKRVVDIMGNLKTKQEIEDDEAETSN